ncbi:MAG: hypothetical protein ACK4M4_11075, partial [Flavobacterium sp.]
MTKETQKKQSNRQTLNIRICHSDGGGIQTGCSPKGDTSFLSITIETQRKQSNRQTLNIQICHSDNGGIQTSGSLKGDASFLNM